MSDRAIGGGSDEPHTILERPNGEEFVVTASLAQALVAIAKDAISDPNITDAERTAMLTMLRMFGGG